MKELIYYMYKHTHTMYVQYKKKLLSLSLSLSPSLPPSLPPPGQPRYNITPKCISLKLQLKVNVNVNATAIQLMVPKDTSQAMKLVFWVQSYIHELKSVRSALQRSPRY